MPKLPFLRYLIIVSLLFLNKKKGHWPILAIASFNSLLLKACEALLKRLLNFWLRPLDRNWFSPVIAGTLINRWTRIHTNLWKRQVCVCDDSFSNKEKGFLFSFLIKSIPHFTCHQPFTTHNGHLAWTPSLLLVNVINCPWKFSSKNLLFSKF